MVTGPDPPFEPLVVVVVVVVVVGAAVLDSVGPDPPFGPRASEASAKSKTAKRTPVNFILITT